MEATAVNAKLSIPTSSIAICECDPFVIALFLPIGMLGIDTKGSHIDNYHLRNHARRHQHSFLSEENFLMKTPFARFSYACFLLGVISPSAFAEEKDDHPVVIIETELGSIEVKLDAKAAPKTVANFLKYVDAKLYDGGQIHRTVTPDNQPDNKVKIEVIQAGINPDKRKDEFAAIKLERTKDTKLAHKNGTISMARDGTDTATSDFFICIGDQPELDFGGKRNPDGQGFAAFGQVTKGMGIVKKIHAAKADGQTLNPAIKIASVKKKP
jgi:peptidyl-prolyl cis-trans isomerase A (cyclophilin A)